MILPAPANLTRMKFLHDNWKSTLESMGLTNFDDWWQQDDDTVEAPNTKSGNPTAWSKVSALKTPEGKTIYLKRQQNFYPNNLLQRWRKELTFEREYQNYQKIHLASVPTYELVYFESRKQNGNRQAVYVAEGLDNFTSLEYLMPIWKEQGWPPKKDRRRLLKVLLKTVQHMHQNSILHNALSPRHLFFNLDVSQPYTFPEKIEFKLIDFERLKELKPGSDKAIMRDLFCLHRRGVGWPDSDRIWFLKQYLDIQRLDDRAKAIIRNFTQRVAKKS